MAVKRVQVFRLGVEEQFVGLNDSEKRYAHHMSRAAWYGARVILRQVSPESPAIFDFILELYRSCGGDWYKLLDTDVKKDDLDRFLAYAATFLSNVGNYYGSGDQKFVPGVSNQVLKRLASATARASELYEQFAGAISARPPFSLGYPGDATQSSYYLGEDITKENIASVSKVLEQHSIFPENTRIKMHDNGHDLEVLLASVQKDDREKNNRPRSFPLPGEQNGWVHLVQGDHCSDLSRICDELVQASKYTANEKQKAFLKEYMASFQTGSLDSYRESQRIWVRDKAPRVESIFGFVEPYRDPHGIRAEFEGLVAIADDGETKLLSKLVENSDKFIRRLPWVVPFASDQLDKLQSKGPFEKVLFEPPDFSSIHSLFDPVTPSTPGRAANCFPYRQLLHTVQYNDIRQEYGFKNVIIANRMAAESQTGADASHCPFIDASEAVTFMKHKFPAFYWWVVLHELLGHGTGRMMVETEDGKYNFDIADPPTHLITSAPITSWYKPGQTWTGQFGDLATTVDECRAELVGAYLMDEIELLALLGFVETSEVTAADLTYNLYQQLATDGLRGLSNFNVDSGKWGQAHSRAHFAILKCLLQDGAGVIRITHDKQSHDLKARVDRSKIVTHGKPALGKMLLHLHMYRCTADVDGCRKYYEGLSRVDGEYLEWRETVLANKAPPLVFVQANTFLDESNGSVTLKEYDATVEGVVQSWAERNV